MAVVHMHSWHPKLHWIFYLLFVFKKKNLKLVKPEISIDFSA